LQEARRQPDPHTFARQGPRWICTKCGITARRSARKLGGCSQAARVVDRLHSTHRLFVALREEQGLLTPFYFCNRCGAHSTTRVAALHTMCLPKLIPTPAMKRLAAGRHPRTNGDLVSVRRLRLAAVHSVRASTTAAHSSSQPLVPVDTAPEQLDDFDPEMEAARELGLGTAFDDSD
jgi:ribosomal protein S27AE